MYENWMKEDGKDKELTLSKIKEIQAQIDEVQSSQSNHEDSLREKELLLLQKESTLAVGRY
jgi:hypothetical protein